MSAVRILAIVLLLGGVLSLAYGGFTYTRSTSEANIGPISIEVEERERVNIPVWAGVAGVLLGGILLVAPRGKA
jgi:hypothetical protein